MSVRRRTRDTSYQTLPEVLRNDSFHPGSHGGCTAAIHLRLGPPQQIRLAPRPDEWAFAESNMVALWELEPSAN